MRMRTSGERRAWDTEENNDEPSRDCARRAPRLHHTSATAHMAGLHGVAALCLAACAATPAPPAAPAVVRPPVVSAPAAPDVSEVPAPARLAALMRWRTPHGTLETIYQWTGIRLSAPDLAGEAYDRGLADTLAYDAPVDAVVAIDAPPSSSSDRDVAPLVAVAFGVRSIDAARRAAQAVGTVTDGPGGEYRIRLKASKRHGEKAFCVLTAAAGAAPGRFVCGQRERDVDALAPFMARTLPRRDFGPPDVHIELHVPPVLDAYGPALNQGLRLGAAYLPRKAQIGEPVFDRALERAASGLAQELGTAAKDLDTLSVDVALAPNHASVDATVKMRGQLSWTAGTLATQAARAAEPPPMFWRLPHTATAASYQHPPDHARFADIRHTLGELLDGWLLHEGVPPPDRAPLVGILSDKYAFAAPWVSASGTFAAPGKTPGGAAGTTAMTAPPTRGADEVQDGWHLTGFAGATPIADMAKTFVAGVNRPKIQALLKSAASRATGDEPPSSARPKQGPLPMSIRSVAPPKGLPPGSLDFEVTMARDLARRSGSATAAEGERSAASAAENAANAKAAAKSDAPVTMHLLIVSRPQETWVGFASQRDKLAATMAGVLEGAKDAQTLATRTDLDTLRKGPFVSASFSTLDGILRSWRSPLVRALGIGKANKNLDEVHAVLESAPHKGLTPMLLTTATTTDGPPTVHAHLDVPKGVIEDVIIAAASSLMQGLARP